MSVLLFLLLLAVYQAYAAQHVVMTEYISNACDGEIKSEQSAGVTEQCAMTSAESSVMMTCNEYREYPNAECRGMPEKVQSGCFHVTSSPETYLTITCKDVQDTIAATTTCNSSGDLSSPTMEEIAVDEIILPPMKTFEAISDENVIIPVQTSPGSVSQVSSPYKLMASIAIFFVVF